MKTTIKSFACIAALLALTTPSSAQDISLKGRSALEINVGFWGGAKASNSFTSTGVQSEAKTSGFLGSVLFSYWMREQVALTLSAGLLAGEASSSLNTTVIGQHASTVTPILIGIKYYFLEPSPEDAVRPFVSAAVGSYIGSEASNTLLSQEARTEQAIGGRFGAGVDAFLGNHFKLGANVRYNVMADYETPIGARTNYSGAEFSIGVGFIF
jgi:hypothetical protein